MNLLDIIAGVAIIYGAFKGFMNGAIREIFSLLGLIIGLWMALRLAFLLANWYRDTVEIPADLVPLVSFLTAFAIGFVLMMVIGRLLSGFLKATHLSLVDKIAGGAVGAAKWAFFVGGLFILVGNANILPERWPEDSISYKPLTGFSKGVYAYSGGLVSSAGDVLTEVEDYFHDLDSTRTGSDSLSVPNDSLQAHGGRN